ncbi:hypothetical protein [Demequina lignilytica]|uniref:LPXTG-motif cell wall anchor domain-containing protein n=1 Tax=Demequina lignilytica TaxID=3051663 RepID=A0AB35MK68_9MICO|nr:hypothetical protein [Demequina sp. SYSU T0a273]MDN4484179.1 hypothetical protein [Demequina sp. SYSU T0a273]
MIRKTIAALALAGAMVLAPVAAQAAPVTYPASEYTITCSVTTVAAGKTFECTVTGPNGGTLELRVTLPGGKVITVKPTSFTTDSATFSLTAPSELGVLGVTAVSEGSTVGTATVDVVSASTGTDSGLASTGFENTGLAIGAGALLVAGAATVFVAARRRQMQDA